MDYNFAGEGDEEVATWLTMVESKFGAVWSRVVERKGISEETEWVVMQMVEEIDEWGYRGEDVVLRSDQEGAIEVVKRKVAELRVGRTMMDESPVGESSANGRAEDAGKRVRDQARVLKDQVEHKTGEALEVDGDVMQWLVR